MLGQLYSTLGDLQKALDFFTKYYNLEKTPDSTYQMAYTYYEMNELEKAIPYAEEYLKYDRNCFSMANILILALYTKGDYNEAKKYETLIREIRKNSDDDYIRRKDFFFIYSFSYSGYEIDVYEKFDLTGDFYYPLTCNVKSNGEVIKTVNLEYDSFSAEFGHPYFLGTDVLKPKSHTTYISFSEFPKFDEFIKYVKLAIDGKLSSWASSSYY